MKKYTAIATVTLASCELELTSTQAAARKHILSKTEKEGIYFLNGKTQFKAGEEFGYKGDIPKAIAACIESGDDRTEKAERTIEITMAIDELDAENSDHWTNDNKPQVKALEEVLGEDITAAERDAAWVEYNKSE